MRVVCLLSFGKGPKRWCSPEEEEKEEEEAERGVCTKSALFLSSCFLEEEKEREKT